MHQSAPNSTPSPARQRIPTAREIRLEFSRRRLRDFVGYTYADYKFGWVHDEICQALDWFLAETIAERSPRLIVSMPPAHGKTELVSRRFPAFAFGCYPWLKIIATAHTAALAQANSRDVQAIMDSAEFHDVFPKVYLPGSGYEDSKRTDGVRTATEFDIVGKRRSYRCAGVGGSITGSHGNILIVDDPIVGAAQALSETYRESLWNWYGAELDARKLKGAGIIVMATRWYPDDLPGRLIKQPLQNWRVITYPAIAEVDEPHRKIGEALDEARHPLRELLASKPLNEYFWSAVYQQRPAPLGGGIIKPGRITVVDALPADIQLVRGWDFGSTVGGDPTAGVKLGRDNGGRYYVCDVKRFSDGPDIVEATLKNTAAADGRSVQISMPQDPGQAGKSQVLSLTRMLAGYPVSSSPETGDKVTRALPFAAQVNVGNVYMLRAPWNESYTAELALFPTGPDDQVDASSRAFNYFADSSANILEFYKQQNAARASGQAQR